MERKYYRDNFETYLKDQADEFKIYPSQRVWHGIYNDFHPGRRWPSLSTMLFIVSFLVLLNGYNAHRHLITIVPESTILIASNTKAVAGVTLTSSASKTDTKASVINFLTGDEKHSAITEDKIITTSVIEPGSVEVSQPHITNSVKITNVNQQALLIIPISLKDKTTQTPTLYSALHLSKSYTSKFSFSYFVTPSISYRTIFNNIVSTSSPYTGAATTTPALSGPDNSDYGTQKPVLGFAVGSNINYRLNSNLKVNTGLQLSYSGYDITANTIHPKETAFLLNDDGQPREVSATSYFGNDPQADSKVTLHNYSWQASIPIGMEYRIAGNDNLSISAAANVLPTYVISSNAYLLSEDRHSYVNYPSVMRDFNVNTEVGTYVSFGMNKFRWEVGPHFRYQLLSTYNSTSPYGEHLFDYGIRFGITKKK